MHDRSYWFQKLELVGELSIIFLYIFKWEQNSWIPLSGWDVLGVTLFVSLERFDHLTFIRDT